MYEIIMKVTTRHRGGEYLFGSKREAEEFLQGLNDYELDRITSITKYNKKSSRPAWNDFFYC